MINKNVFVDRRHTLRGDAARSSALAASAPAPSIAFYSAHYPILLGLLASLGVAADSGDSSDSWLEESVLGLSSGRLCSLLSARRAHDRRELVFEQAPQPCAFGGALHL